MKKEKWTEWKPITEETSCFKGGVYRIRLKNCSISRFLGKDKEGILIIGESSKIEDRRQKFMRGIEKCSGHSEGKLLNLLVRNCPKLKNKFPTFKKLKNNLEFKFFETKKRKKLEEKEIKSYIINYGEPPPLNSAIPNRYGDVRISNRLVWKRSRSLW